jgi:hypothetical protein
MKITDKIIYDMFDGHLSKEGLKHYKEVMKRQGYEIEEEKSKLEIAREYEIVGDTPDKYLRGAQVVSCNLVVELRQLYEDAIEEMQERNPDDYYAKLDVKFEECEYKIIDTTRLYYSSCGISNIYFQNYGWKYCNYCGKKIKVVDNE